MNDDTNKLFVAGLPEDITENVLRDLFIEAGVQVVEVSLPRDRATGRPRGFAFVRLGSPTDVERALSMLNGHIVGGASISVRRFNAERPARGERPAGGGPGGGPGGGGGGGGGFGPRPGGGGPRGPAMDTSDRTLYVGNLPYDATQEEVETTLRERGVGPIARVHLPLDADGRRRGFGFVTLGSAEVATAAIDQLRGAAVRGRPLVINIAQPRAPGGSPRPDRAGGGPGGPPGVPGGPPADPASRFGPPAKPGGRNDYGKRKRPEDDGPRGKGGGGGGGGGRRQDERWRTDDDDDD